MTEPIIQAKALMAKDRSNAIIVSFDAKWHDYFKRAGFSFVIRKRIPKDTSYEWLYAHINSPVGAICGRTKIKRICNISLNEAIGLSNEIGLSSEDICAYVGNDRSVGCYQVGSFELALNPARTEIINDRINYSPPQSFLILSKSAKQIIDAMCDFQDISIEGATHLDV